MRLQLITLTAGLFTALTPLHADDFLKLDQQHLAKVATLDVADQDIKWGEYCEKVIRLADNKCSLFVIKKHAKAIYLDLLSNYDVEIKVFIPKEAFDKATEECNNDKAVDLDVNMFR